MRTRAEWTGWVLGLGVCLATALPSCTNEAPDTGGTGGGTGGETGDPDPNQPCVAEAPPSGARCADGAVRWRFSWWDAPCDLASQFPPMESVHECALGCRNEGETSWESETMFLMCEEGSVRGVGFPCTFDIDCRSPVGASEPPKLGLGGLGGAEGSAGPVGAVEEALLVCVSGSCQLEEPAAVPSDLGQPCTMAPPSAQVSDLVDYEVNAAVGHAASCETGACLAVEPGATQGICVTGCSATLGCPAGSSCVDVVDDRYSPWGYLGVDGPLRLEVCVPDP